MRIVTGDLVIELGRIFSIQLCYDDEDLVVAFTETNLLLYAFFGSVS